MYKEEDMNDCQTKYLTEANSRLQQATDITPIISKYMWQKKRTLTLKAIALDSS